MRSLEFVLRGEFITLDALLKATGLAPSGGAAKLMVAGGLVQFAARRDLRKACTLRAGQVVAVTGTRVRVMADPDAPPS